MQRRRCGFESRHRAEGQGTLHSNNKLSPTSRVPDPFLTEILTVMDEDIITIHLGRVVPEEVYNQIVKDIVKLLEQKYPTNANWYLDS